MTTLDRNRIVLPWLLSLVQLASAWLSRYHPDRLGHGRWRSRVRGNLGRGQRPDRRRRGNQCHGYFHSLGREFHRHWAFEAVDGRQP